MRFIGIAAAVFTMILAHAAHATGPKRGVLDLVAVVGWLTRRVLSWRLSNTMDVEFCIAALEEAWARFGRPSEVEPPGVAGMEPGRAGQKAASP